MVEWKKTHCNKCALSCGLEMEVEDNKIIHVRPDKDNPRSRGYCCRKGRASKYFLDNPDRLNYPLKRVGDEYVQISWEQAYKEIAEKGNEIIKKYGPKSFALVGCALASSQVNLPVAGSLARAIGSPYLYNPIGIEFMGSWWSNGKIYGDQARFVEGDEENCDVYICWGCNTYVSHNVLNARWVLRDKSEDPNKMLIVVDPRLSETARMSDMHVQPRSGTDSLLLRAIIALILKKGWQDQEYIDKRVADFNKVKPWFENFDIDEALRVCGVPYEQIEKFCRILTTRKWGMHQDLGLFFGRHNTMNSYLAVTLMAICGTLLMDENNVVTDEFALRGNNIHEDTDPNVIRTVTTNKFPVLGTYPVAVLAQEILSDNPEHLRFIISSQSNPVRSYPQSKKMEKALKECELYVAIDICETESTKCADYVLPGKTGYESFDFNIFQLFYPHVFCALKHPIISQIGERKDDTLIWVELADAMGFIPELPQSLFDAAKKAVETNDRIPYFLELMNYMQQHPEQMGIILLIVGKTLGKEMGGVAKSIMWAALMTSPLIGTGIVQRAGFGPEDKHPELQGDPQMSELIMMDNVFQAVDDHPEGVIIGETNTETFFEDHVLHEDKKLHLYCYEINEYIQRITPEKEEKELTQSGEFNYLIDAGRHADDGHNTTMRNPATYVYRNPYVMAMNPDDVKKMGFEDGQMVRVSTKVSSIEIPIESSWQAAAGHSIIPHHFGLQVNGETVGQGVSELASEEDMDELTGNPYLRYVPCRIEAI